jgi:hypothetical protein
MRFVTYNIRYGKGDLSHAPARPSAARVIE